VALLRGFSSAISSVRSVRYNGRWARTLQKARTSGVLGDSVLYHPLFALAKPASAIGGHDENEAPSFPEAPVLDNLRSTTLRLVTGFPVSSILGASVLNYSHSE
jgi:hypothetical protein